MNILYCSCIEQPWLNVAKELEAKGYKAKYWIGWPESGKKISTELDTIFHDISLAWKGNFPKELQSNYPFPATIDGTELKQFASEELIAIRMMERMDRDRHSFTFKERQYFFRRLLNDWIHILQSQEINLIISPSIPHRSFDYVIYVAAKILNIEFLTFKKTRWQGELIPLHNSFDTIPNLTLPNTTLKNQKVKDYLHKILSKSYQEAEPDYMVAQKKDAQKNFPQKLADKAKKKPQQLLHLFDELPIHWKKKGERIETSSFTRFGVYLDEYKGNLYKKKLKEYYESTCSKVKIDEKYILVAFHYQPEVNSVPEGNIYGDQLLMVRALLKHTPDDVQLYIKEHSSQFMPKLEGQTGRTKEFYDQLLSFDRVKLLSTKKDPFSLIDGSIGVATLIGNICLEAIIRGKPVILFGNAWYEHVHGVLKIKESTDMQLIMKHITEFQPDSNLLEQQMHNILSLTLRANHYKFVEEQSDITNEESVENLVDYIQSHYTF